MSFDREKETGEEKEPEIQYSLGSLANYGALPAGSFRSVTPQYQHQQYQLQPQQYQYQHQPEQQAFAPTYTTFKPPSSLGGDAVSSRAEDSSIVKPPSNEQFSWNVIKQQQAQQKEPLLQQLHQNLPSSHPQLLGLGAEQPYQQPSINDLTYYAYNPSVGGLPFHQQPMSQSTNQIELQQQQQLPPLQLPQHMYRGPLPLQGHATHQQPIHLRQVSHLLESHPSATPQYQQMIHTQLSQSLLSHNAPVQRPPVMSQISSSQYPIPPSYVPMYPHPSPPATLHQPVPSVDQRSQDPFNYLNSGMTTALPYGGTDTNVSQQGDFVAGSSMSGLSKSAPSSSYIDPLQQQTRTRTRRRTATVLDMTPETAQRNRCRICNKQFRRPSSLKTHYYTHTGEKIFKCPWKDCGKLFSVKSNMTRHYRLHERDQKIHPEQEGVDQQKRS
ncbi:uncharacterized protein PRCAT00005480001 [Priceomyces carsonii]|uniref:uncharacterized protein n=1 Tax=Priceomyces carsonii TaxID=28549 RepID=UPI002ED89B63|nr:unnamed protein product [Priceomyces carsonii]